MNPKTPNAGPQRRPPLDAESQFLLRLVESNSYVEVEAAARRILARRPAHHLGMKALSFALIGLERFEEALPLLDRAVKLYGVDPELHNNRGIVQSELLQWDAAIASFNHALGITPDDPEVLKNLGVAYFRLHRWGDAIPPLLRAIEVHPGDYVAAVDALTICLLNGGRLDEAKVCLDELWGSDATNLPALYHLISCGLRRCDWTDLGSRIAELRARSDDFAVLLDTPFSALSFPGLDNRDHQRIAHYHVRNMVPKRVLEDPATWRARPHDGPLRVGYLSADFREHPVGFVVPQVIELHDRQRVEVFGYSMGIDDGSAIRRRLAAAFDHFTDISKLSVPQMVERLRADNLDVLVDLHGWTSDARPEALGMRCATVQVNWLGYAGTLGHRRLADYILADAVVLPLADAGYFDEQIAHLPHCYLPLDATRPIPPAPPRAALGLPEGAFVFCSFNNAYKFNPPLFDLWCRILAQAPDSVLWLSRPAGGAPERLQEEARRRGIDPARLVFAPRADDLADHLARIQLADLALDTFPYNSHSSGTDTLWAGVPMVSVLGNTFASRVGASLLRAAGLDELVARDTDEYAEIALRLFRDRTALRGMRARLGGERARIPLFDMSAFTAALETAYQRMLANVLDDRIEPVLPS
jgi:predicted O-linked N-acetylglucosamine transferase (SPINDLY family)